VHQMAAVFAVFARFFTDCEPFSCVFQPQLWYGMVWMHIASYLLIMS
jgi:hypothetical protein